MFQFRRFPTYCYFIHSTLTRYCRAGFPHSDIHGSKDICSSPWLFAACHVLLRLLMPRHSPCALSSLTFVGAKSARLRFRRQPMAVCENCARFLAPPLNFKTRFEVVCGGTLNADLTPCYGHIAVSQNYAGVTEVFAYCCVTLKSSTFFSLPRIRAAPSVALLASSVQFSRCSLPAFETGAKYSKSLLSILVCSQMLVEISGFEPLTSCVQSRRSPN